MFQFPLHRDPRCNSFKACHFCPIQSHVSVPFTSGSSLQHEPFDGLYDWQVFQFPLHRDPRCNVKFTGQPGTLISFSSLYIGILAATHVWDTFHDSIRVSVPFTSGSSLQPNIILLVTELGYFVSVPFTSGSSLQRQ